jgi:hypothetical protein
MELISSTLRLRKINSAMQHSPRGPDLARWHHNLARLLEMRFERTGDRQVLEDAIVSTQSAVEATAPETRRDP